MSILQRVMEQYGDSEMAKALPDRTDKRACVSSVSQWSELLENKNGELELDEIPIAIEMVEITEMREQGIAPGHYTATTECRHCGPVPIWEGCPTEVLGCPWCFNRLKALPIPRIQIDEPADNR